MTLPVSDPLISGSTLGLTTYNPSFSTFNFGSGQLTVNLTGCFNNVSGTSLGYWNADTFPNDQFSQVTLVTNTSTTLYVGPAVRANGTGGGNCYWFAVRSDGVNYVVQKEVAGTPTNIIGATTNAFANGDILKITAVGTLVSIFQNGTLLNSIVDASLTGASSAAGFVCNGTTNVGFVKTWSAGAVQQPVIYTRKNVLYFI